MVPIFVVLTILVCVSVDALVQMRKKKQGAAVPVRRVEFPENVAGALAIPAGRFVHPGHAWMEIHPSGRVRVGLDGFLRRAVGALDRVVLLPSGKQLRQGEAMLTLERSGRRLWVPAPVSGTIVATNSGLAAHPESLEGSPDRSDWAYTLTPTRLGSEIGVLKVAESAAQWMAGEIRRFTEWVLGPASGQPAVALQDGGVPVAGALESMDDAAWEEFQSRFLGAPGTGTNRTSDRPL